MFHKKGLLLIVAVCIIALGGFLFFRPNSPVHPSFPTKNKAAEQLYNALENAAKAPKLHVAMYREGFANKADADAQRNRGDIASSVSEIDTINGHYRNVWAVNYFHYPEFSVGRCVDNVSYIEDYTHVNKSPRAATLKNIDNHLKLLPSGHLSQTTNHLPHDPCPKFGIIPGGTSDLATARLSDGVFPVTLSPKEAEAWKNKIQAANLFVVKDEGTTEKNGKTLRKLSFTPQDENSVNQKLYDIFYRVVDIEKLKTEHPNAPWEHAFISINYANNGSIGGYYLIDETTNLPVYSELYSTNPDRKTDGGPLSKKTIYHTKQNYSFPTELTITEDTQLEFKE